MTLQFLPTWLPCARMAEQIVTWMHNPPDQELSSVLSPAHAARTHMAMTMLPADADGLMRKWRVRLKLKATRLKPSMSQSVWFTCSSKNWRVFCLTPIYLYPALSVTQRLSPVFISRSVEAPAVPQIQLAGNTQTNIFRGFFDGAFHKKIARAPSLLPEFYIPALSVPSQSPGRRW